MNSKCKPTTLHIAYVTYGITISLSIRFSRVLGTEPQMDADFALSFGHDPRRKIGSPGAGVFCSLVVIDRKEQSADHSNLRISAFICG